MLPETKPHSWSDVLTTPLGSVSCSAHSSAPFASESDDSIVRSSGSIRMRLESFDLPTDWNNGFGSLAQRINGGRCWRWYFDCRSDDITEIELRCGLMDIPTAFWDAVTGENLAAVEYDINDVVLHIGTEDDDRLSSRTLQHDGLFPARFKDLLTLPASFSADLIALEKTGIRIHVPHLLAGEQLYFHLIVAFKSRGGQEDLSTWTAVDRSKREIDASWGAILKHQ